MPWLVKSAPLAAQSGWSFKARSLLTTPSHRLSPSPLSQEWSEGTVNQHQLVMGYLVPTRASAICEERRRLTEAVVYAAHQIQGLHDSEIADLLAGRTGEDHGRFDIAIKLARQRCGGSKDGLCSAPPRARLLGRFRPICGTNRDR